MRDHREYARASLRNQMPLPKPEVFARSWALPIEEARKMICAEEASRR